MARMSPLETFLVNRAKGRANARLFKTLREDLRLPPDSVCLEVGCGKGDMAVRLVEAFRPKVYVATDYDAAQVARARARVSRAPPPIRAAIEIRTADALVLPFPDLVFDAVFAFAVFHHVEDRFWRYEKIPAALDEIGRVLRAGGRLAYEEWVHKPRLRTGVVASGYRIERRRRIHLGLAEVVVARRPADPDP